MGQVMNKFKQGEPTREQADKLADEIKPIVDQVYEDELKPKNGEINYDDLYHAIFSVIQELRKKNGAMQFELPSKDDLNKAFEYYHKSKGPLTKKECSEIIGKMITLDRFSIGQGAIDILLYLFGIPICALMAKRIIPGIRSISDDVVLPIATSGSVIFLAKTNKL